MDTGSSARISFGPQGQGLREADPLALAAAQLVRVALQHLGGRGQPHHLEDPLRLGCRCSADSSGRCSLRPRRMPCEIRSTGLIELNGSWKTIGTSPV